MFVVLWVLICTQIILKSENYLVLRLTYMFCWPDNESEWEN